MPFQCVYWWSNEVHDFSLGLNFFMTQGNHSADTYCYITVIDCILLVIKIVVQGDVRNFIFYFVDSHFFITFCFICYLLTSVLLDIICLHDIVIMNQMFAIENR